MVVATGRRAEASAQLLLQAAVELIAEQGFQRTTTAQISRRAGFSSAMMHVRYGSKDGLLDQLLDLYERQLLIDPGPGDTGLQSILGQVDLCRRVVVERPEFLRAFCMLAYEAAGPVDAVRPRLLEWRRRYCTHTANVLRAGQVDGSVRPELDPESEAQAFQDFASGMCFRWTLDPGGVDLVRELDRWRARLEAWLRPW